MSNPEPTPTSNNSPGPLPFKPELPAVLRARARRALVNVWTVEQADVDAWATPDNVFDFAEGVRLVITVEQAEQPGEGVPPLGGLLLHVAAEAPDPMLHPPLTARDGPKVLWFYHRVIDAQQTCLHTYTSGHRVHIIYPAPAEAGVPLPPEPEPEPPPEPEIVEGPEGTFQRPPREVFDIEIPPGLRAGLPGVKAKATPHSFE